MSKPAVAGVVITAQSRVLTDTEEVKFANKVQADALLQFAHFKANLEANVRQQLAGGGYSTADQNTAYATIVAALVAAGW